MCCLISFFSLSLPPPKGITIAEQIVYQATESPVQEVRLTYWPGSTLSTYRWNADKCDNSCQGIQHGHSDCGEYVCGYLGVLHEGPAESNGCWWVPRTDILGRHYMLLLQLGRSDE
jgi:hypothetical protein